MDQPYEYWQQQEEKKEIPLAVVIVSGIAIWVLIFGSIFAYSALQPCSFTKTLVGEETFVKFQNPALRTPPCDPTVDPGCTAWPLDTADSCRCFLRFAVVGKGC